MGLDGFIMQGLPWNIAYDVSSGVTDYLHISTPKFLKMTILAISTPI